MEETYQVQELKYSNMEMESKSLDAELENEGNWEDLDNFEAVVPYVDNVVVPLESYSLSSGRIVIWDLPLQLPLMKPLATSTPKAFTEHALNQGMAESFLERHSLDRENDDV